MDPAEDPPARPVSDARRRLVDRRFWLLLGLITAAALAVRVGYLLVVDPAIGEISDAGAYHRLANNLADGRGYIRPYDLAQEGIARPTAEYPPLFPTVLAGASLLGVTSIDGQRLFLCGLGATTVLVIALVGRRVGGAAVGLVAAALAAGYPMLFQSDAALMPETLAALAGALIVLTALRARVSAAWWRWGALGAVIVASALTRTETLLFLPLLVVPLAWRLADADRRRQVLLIGVAVLAAAAVLAPWTVRNLLTFDRFVPFSNNSGSALRGANCDLTYGGELRGLWITSVSSGDGPSTVDPDDRCFGGFEFGPGEDESEVAAEERAEGLAYARAHLGEVPGVMAVRWLRTFGLYRFDQQTGFESFEGRNLAVQRAGTRAFHGLAVMALAGAVVLVRRRGPLWPLASTVVVVTITALVTYGNQRFRATAEPAVVVLAAIALVAAGTWLLRRTKAAAPA
ncbi:hypothetical protein BH20ACT2_BH20ACT2_06120 [soil metagenome]